MAFTVKVPAVKPEDNIAHFKLFIDGKFTTYLDPDTSSEVVAPIVPFTYTLTAVSPMGVESDPSEPFAVNPSKPGTPTVPLSWAVTPLA